MCVAIPMKVVEILDEFTALVDRDGIKLKVHLGIVDVPPKVGDYVIVHAGFAIKTMTEEDAKENIELIKSVFSSNLI